MSGAKTIATLAWAAGALFGLVASPAMARDPPYGALHGAAGEAALTRCDALQWSSSRDRAPACYRALLGAAEAWTRAEAAWALGDFQAANAAFRDALRTAPANAQLRVRWGELYRDTHQDEEANKLFSEALAKDPADAWAHVGAASVLVDSWSKEGTGHLEAVFANASAPAGARYRADLLAARVALENGALDRADPLLTHAASVAEAAGLPTLELHAMRAAEAVLRGQDASVETRAVLTIDPGYGEVYAVLGHFYEVQRRYDEANAMYRQAIALDPALWDAHVELANGLLRENRVSEARAEYEAAYKGDPYNPVTVNSLRLLDSLSRFATLVYPPPASGSASASASAGAGPRMIVRVARKESDVLAPYVRRLAERAMATYSRRYHYELREPVVIEIYDNHADFAVRTAGLPGIGLLGVTFGRVLAIDSPSSRPVNEFHWGSTLWHELAHVYTLESTNHRVPRWLSEGLSVYEEWTSGPIAGVHIPGYAFAAFAAGKALPVAGLDQGFIRPSYEQQVEVSYMQAGLVCLFIAERWKFDALVAMLAAYRDGADTPGAIRQALGIDATEFDRLFAAWLKERYGRTLEGLEPWRSARTEAAAAAGRRDWERATASAARAIALMPDDVEDGSPYLPLAEGQRALGQDAKADATLEDYWRRGGHDPSALRRLATAMHDRGRATDALAVMEDIEYVAPFDEAQHGEYGDWLLAADRAADALAEYRVALALEPPDRATAWYRVARASLALEDRAGARTAVLRALEIAPEFAPAQQLLLRVAGGAGRPATQDRN